MKTPAEIKEYLEAQEWYSDFVKNILNHNTSEEVIGNVFAGSYGKETISSAFPWDKSEEGSDFWKNIDKKFSYWFDSDDYYYHCKVTVCSFKRNRDSKLERGIMVYTETEKSIIIDKFGNPVESVYIYNIYFDEGTFITELK